MRRLRDESGFTLTEVLIAMVLLTIVMGATLDVLDGFAQRTRTNTRQNDAQDSARQAIDRITAQLRNLASPTDGAKSIDRATNYDLVFQTVNPTKRRLRYCLDSTDPANAELWVQTQSLPVSADPPSWTACPGPVGAGEWSSKQVVATNVVNRINDRDRPVFTYTGLGEDTDTAKITGIRARLFLDVNPGSDPAEVSLASGDFLRNQNQNPSIADFSMVQSPPGSHNFILNGSDATDPEGRTLDYLWYRGNADTGTLIGRGITLSYTFFPSDRGVQDVTLKVVDPGGLSATLTKQTPPLRP